MHTTKAIAERFRDLDFHDDTFVGMSISPAQTRDDNAGSVVEIRLSPYQSEDKRVLQFIGCANLRVNLDFDILASNLPPNTSRVDAHADGKLMRELMESQKRDWDVGYGKMRSPLDDKLELIDELVWFRLQFFGGAVEIIAREFLIEQADDKVA
jgi:hypothetical protein